VTLPELLIVAGPVRDRPQWPRVELVAALPAGAFLDDEPSRAASRAPIG
jgi:hypothetical protein